MTVARSQRTYPLTLTASSLNTGIVAAYDWAPEDGSTTLGNGKDHSGNARNWTAPSTAPTIVTTSAGKGVDLSIGRTSAANYYLASNCAAVGLGVGTGDFTIWKRIRTPSVAASGTVVHSLGRFGGAITIELYEIVGNGGYNWYIEGASTFLNWTDSSALGANIITDLHIVRTNGNIRVFVDGVFKKQTANTSNLTTDGNSALMGVYTSPTADFVEIDDIYWGRALSDAEVAAHQANPYSYYANSVPADSVTVTSPTASATAPANIPISGTYAGGTTVTSVEASFNGGAYATIASSPTGGAFSGTLTGQTPGTGTLTVRTKNGSTVVATTTVTGLTVVSDSISLSGSGVAVAMANRLFQRNSSNQATVTVSGSYVGTPTSIEYSWNGGSWQTLVASPSGGTFSGSATLQGPGMGTLSVRFSNSTGISASLANVGVGDLYAIYGQSNNVGFATTYVAPAAPAAHPGWVPVVYDKAGRWRADVETSAQPFDSIVSGDTATYSVDATTNGKGSYFGALATQIMAQGVPVGFIPCALESTGANAWVPNTATTTLYGAMLARVAAVGSVKGFIRWQGEADVVGGTTRSQMESYLSAEVNDLHTRFPSAKIILINLCESVGSTGGGTAGTDTGYNAIHAAIANVAATNTSVAAIGDMAGKFSQLHYDTVPEINAVATVAYNALNAAVGYAIILATTASATLKLDASTAAASLTGLKWAFFDQATPDVFAAPVAKGASGSTNSSGVFSAFITGTTLATGATGWLVVTNSDGTVAGRSAAKVFDGPVVVS